MSDSPFYVPVTEFQTGDVLSSTKLNQMLSNMDYVYGLDQTLVLSSMKAPLSNDAVARFERTQWDGYVAHTGNTLVYEFASPRAGRHIVYHPGATQFRFSAALSGQRTQLLPAYFGNAGNRFRVFRVTVENDDPNAQGAAQPLYMYTTDTSAASIGSMPAFANGTVPTAANFNVLVTATDRLKTQLEQPVGYSRARFEDNDYLTPTDAYPYYGSISYYAPYRHTWFQFFLTAGAGTPPEHPERLAWKVGPLDETSDSEFWSWSLYTGHPAQDVYSVPIGSLGLVVGTWYKWTYYHEGASDYSGPRGFSRLYWAGQQRTNTAGDWGALTRWELGDVVNGDSGGPPNLAEMTANLGWLDTRRSDKNLVSRANMSNDYAAYNETFFSRRVHRWLAYESSTSNPTLRYGLTTQPRLQSVSFPATSGTAYLDLDSTPIRPGMMMYGSGVKFMIQVPSIP